MVCALTLLGTISAAQAQTTSARRDTASVCFKPKPLPDCRSFAIVELELASMRHHNPETFSDPRQTSYFGTLDSFLSVDVGWLHNRRDGSALGGTLAVATMFGDGGRFALKARYRRWMTNRSALDLQAGPLAVSGGSNGSPFGRNGALGATVGAAFAYRDYVAVVADVDAVKGDRGQTASFIGVRAGSWAAPIFAVGLLALFAATISSIE